MAADFRGCNQKPPPFFGSRSLSAHVGHKNGYPYEKDVFTGSVLTTRNVGQENEDFMPFEESSLPQSAQSSLSPFPGTFSNFRSDNGDHESCSFVSNEECLRTEDSCEKLLNQRPYFGINGISDVLYLPPNDDHGIQPPPVNVSQNFDLYAAGAAHPDLDVLQENFIVPPFFAFEQQQNDDTNRSSNTPSSFGQDQHNAVAPQPSGPVKLSIAAVEKFLSDIQRGIFLPLEYYQLWNMEQQELYAQLAAGLYQPPPQSNHIAIEDYPFEQQSDADAIGNADENYILEGRIFYAQRAIPGFNDFEVCVKHFEDHCTYDMEYVVCNAFGSYKYSYCGSINFPSLIFLETFHHWVQDGYLNVEAELI